VAKVNPLIAVVDDEASVRTMLRRALRLADYEVVDYASGEAFLQSLPGPVPTCLILDLHLQGLSGLAIEQRLRTRGLHIPFILITASDDPSIDAAAAEAGAVRLLRKPFSTDLLLAAVRDAEVMAARGLNQSPVPGGRSH